MSRKTVFGVSMNEDQLAEVGKLAERFGVSRAEVMRMGLRGLRVTLDRRARQDGDNE